MFSTELYQQRHAAFEQLAHQYQRKFNQLSWARVLLFGLGIISSYGLWHGYGGFTALAGGTAFLAAFIFLLQKHTQVGYQRNHAQHLSLLNQDEAARMGNQFLREETGEIYEAANHPYSADLDIFGKHSVFRILNRTRTWQGAKQLATWLQTTAIISEITSRQVAVQELTAKLAWRQELEAVAMHYLQVHLPIQGLLDWVAEPLVILPSSGLRSARALPFLTIPLLLAWAMDWVPSTVALSMILVHLLILSKVFKAVKQTCDKTTAVTQTLLAYANIIKHIEDEHFESKPLCLLQGVFKQQYTLAASDAVQRLATTLRNLNYRNNPYFYALVGIASLWDLHFLLRTEQWKKEYRDSLPQWLAALAEWEALNSLAGFAFSNPAYTWPIVTAEPMVLQAEALGHVLIPASKRVTNDVQLDGMGKTLIITGSNMSGKSTFLRTVAINTVLALAGAPVCAERFTTSVVQIFTSMRTQDSLEESVSSFYAELKRLKQLIERGKEGQTLLYFLDEILKGTNSQDRHVGAVALIRQLHQYQASGFISTHDLELGKMAAEHPDYIQNYSFSSEMSGSGLLFDYKLRTGVCQSFNASELMQQIGIEIR